MIYIYNDIGVSKESLKHTIYTASTTLGGGGIILMNAEEIAQGHWQKNARMLIIPGGRDVPYTKRLKGAGNEAIRSYVANGGHYLGIIPVRHPTDE